MPLKKLIGRLRSGLAVITAIETQGPRIAAALGQRFRKVTEDAEKIILGYLTFMAMMLKAARGDLAQAVRRHAEELADDHAPRSRRDNAVTDLRDAMFGVRSVCDGFFDLDKIDSVDFPRRVSDDAVTLLEQSDHLIEQFSKPDLEMPAPRIVLDEEAPAPSFQALIKTLTPKADELREALDVVLREQREAQVTQVDQDQAVQSFDVVFGWGARSAEALFRLAGEEKLAATVAPSRTRPGRTQQEPDVPEEADDSLDGVDPALLEPADAPASSPGPPNP